MNLHFSKQPKLLDVLTQNGLKIMDRPYELNIIGIRSSSVVSNKFDDILHVCYATEMGTWNQHIIPITTDPGTYFLNNPINKLGTALLKHGQYINAYQLGLHRGKYKALVQRKPVTVYRSKNNSTNIDSKTKHTQTGYFGINIHHASGNGTSEDVNRWSAGCQVIANIDDFKQLIQLAEKHAKRYGNQFTYTLLDYRTKGYVPQTYQSPSNDAKEKTNEIINEYLPKPTNSNKGLLIAGITALVGIGTGIYYYQTNKKSA